MLIFNTTFHVDSDICDVYQSFMKQIYIPQAINNGFLHEPRFVSIRSQHGEHGVSFSLQFRVKNNETLDLWLSSDGQLLQQHLVHKFGNKVTGFITLMDEIEL